MGIKLSSSYWAKRKRLQRLPKLSEGLMTSFQKRNALMFIKNFHDGIKNNSFALEKLADGTIRRKRQLGMERPKTPLYGRGDDSQDRSYVNMLRIRKILAGYKVFPSRALHYSGKIKLEDLLEVHENGTIIKGAHGQFIRIPPRPAYSKALQRTVNQIKKREPLKEIKLALNQIVNTGKKELANKIAIREVRGLQKFEVYA